MSGISEVPVTCLPRIWHAPHAHHLISPDVHVMVHFPLASVGVRLPGRRIPDERPCEMDGFGASVRSVRLTPLHNPMQVHTEPAPADLMLADDEVHVWGVTLDSRALDLGRLAQILSPDEQARAERLLRLHDRVRFVAGRGLLRAILARYVGTAPERLQFAYSAHGKPHLAPGWDAGGLCFNLAHSAGLALYAVARRRAVGVDVERVRADFPIEETVAGLLSPQEMAALIRCRPRRAAGLVSPAGAAKRPT